MLPTYRLKFSLVIRCTFRCAPLLCLYATTAVGQVPVGLRTQLFVDDYVVETRQNTSRHSQPASRMPQPVLFGQRPWEEETGGDPRVLLYGTAFYDPLQQQHRMWYMGRMGGGATATIPELDLPGANIHYDLTSYATSSDGINWDRPNLGVTHFNGRPDNNILLDFHGASVFLDQDEPDPNKRYKAIGFMRRFGDIRVSYSPDGIQWSAPEFAANRFNEGGFNAVHVPGIGYIAGSLEISTDPNHMYVDADGDLQGKRVVGVRHTADNDLKNWSHQGFINPDGMDDPDTQFYGMTPFVYGDNGIVFGFIHVFDVIDPQASFHDGPIDVELVYSRDGINWNRMEDSQPVIPLGSPGTYDAGIIWQTGNGVSLQNDELVAYYSAGEFGHGTQGELTIGRATWQRDRLVSLSASSTPGTVTTEQFQLLGDQLELNLDASGGQVFVELLDDLGQPIPGFTLADSDVFQGIDGLQLTPSWQGQTDLSSLMGQTIQLRFTMRSADLYAFQVTGPNRVWNIDGSGDWNSADNWSEGGVPDANDIEVVFGELSATPQTVVTDAVVTVKGLQFYSPQAYVIAGSGSVNLEADSGNATINVDQGTHQMQAVVNLQSPTDVAIATGATLAFNNQLNLNGHALEKTGSGTLEINNELNTGGGMVIGLAGAISGGGALLGDLVNTGSTVAPGNSPGTLSIVGDYQQESGGTLQIEIGEEAHDVLSVSGQIMLLGGTLEVVLSEGFQPQLGDMFDILDFGSFEGSGFETLSLQPMGGGLGWDTSQLSVDGTLSVTAIPEPNVAMLAGLATLMLACRRRIRPLSR